MKLIFSHYNFFTFFHYTNLIRFQPKAWEFNAKYTLRFFLCIINEPSCWRKLIIYLHTCANLCFGLVFASVLIMDSFQFNQKPLIRLIGERREKALIRYLLKRFCFLKRQYFWISLSIGKNILASNFVHWIRHSIKIQNIWCSGFEICKNISCYIIKCLKLWHLE